MELKVLPAANINSTLRAISNNLSASLNDVIKSRSVITATVIEHSVGNNNYLLNFSGKQIRLTSDAKLIVGEKLDLRIHTERKRIELEILGRTIGAKETDFVEAKDGWSKSYFSPLKTIQQAIEPMKAEISVQKIIQFLDVYFPGIEWLGDTPYFDWRFEEGEANGFYGKKNDTFSFYLHLQAKHLGEVDSYFHWKESDFSDFVLHSVFNTLPAYLFANENLPELKKMLSSNSIPANDIIFHYSTLRKEKGDWIA